MRTALVATTTTLAVLFGTVGVFGPTPAHADAGDTTLAIVMRNQTEIHIAVCLNVSDQLPMNIVVAYEATTGGSTVSAATWADEDPNAAVLSAPGCPTEFMSFAITGLAPETSYQVTVNTTLTPKSVTDDGVLDDLSRLVRHDSVTVTAQTLPSSAPTGQPTATDSPHGDASGARPPTDGGETLPSDHEAPVEDGLADTSIAVLDIPQPEHFTAMEMSSLAPEQVALIDPDDFREFPPGSFRGLSPEQAKYVTVEQASAIRPRRASQLRPASVSALTIRAVRALRPAAIKFLRPAAVGAMTRPQLRSLSARQVAAMRPRQLAMLSPPERALLVRNSRFTTLV